MPRHFSIRAYTKSFKRHHHTYHQLVLPLMGSIHIEVGDYQGIASVGDCVIIREMQSHAFSADEAARFIVIDSDNLPHNLLESEEQKIRVDDGVVAFCQFLERQLSLNVDSDVESSAFELLMQLLAQQQNHRLLDKRLEKVIDYINSHLAEPLTITQLATIACLSDTQFKVVFKQQMNMTLTQYLRQLRMSKAKSLLTYTDKPIAIVAQDVGYLNSSAFSRQFKSHFGVSPKHVQSS